MLMFCTILLVISLASGLPVPNASGSGSVEFELPHRRARVFSCEEPAPSREANLRNLGSLETGLAVLQNNSSKLSDEWVRDTIKSKLRGEDHNIIFATAIHVLYNRHFPMQPLTQSPVCTSPVIHGYNREADSLSVESVTAQDIANWIGVFEAYGEVVKQIIARDISTEQKEQLQRLYGVISAVLMDYNQVVSYSDLHFRYL